MKKQGCLQMISRKVMASLLILSCAPQWCFASFMANPYQSASAMGNAFAGAATAGDDASINFYNPAGLMLIEETQVVGVLSYAIADSVLTVDSLKDTNGHPIPDVQGEQISAVPNEVVPAFHIAAPINEDYVLGMSLTGPFGGVTNYAGSSVRSTANDSAVISLNLNVSLAAQVTEELSLGVGVNGQYLTSRVNAYLGNYNGEELENTIFAEYSGDSVAFFPNLGLLHEFSEKTRVGIAYVFPVDHNTSGDGGIDILNLDASVQYPLHSEILLPDSLTFSIFHQLTEEIELMSDAIFTHWSRLHSLVLSTEIPEQPPELAEAPLGLTNTWRISLGANYQYTPALKFRVGVAYDQSPVHDEYRYAQAPDSDRIDASVGLSIAPQSWENLRFDVAYLHSFFANAPIDQDSILNGIGSLPPHYNALVGSYNTSADIISGQFVYTM
jgi:long-chain fatty acid transport protein